MSTTDKAKNIGQATKGKVEKGVGKATGDDRMAAAGQRDLAAADVKQKAEQAKDAVKHVAHAVKGKAKEGVGKATGNDRLSAEGKADQAAARVKGNLDK